jgi:hypothetical protein
MKKVYNIFKRTKFPGNNSMGWSPEDFVSMDSPESTVGGPVNNVSTSQNSPGNSGLNLEERLLAVRGRLNSFEKGIKAVKNRHQNTESPLVNKQ